MDANSLKAGQSYSFRMKDFTVPTTGEVIPGATKVRKLVGTKEVSAGGYSTTFIEVERTDGSRHLISPDYLESATPADEPQPA